MSKKDAFDGLYSAAVPHRRRFAYVDDLPSMTKQEFQDECDINQIMDRYEKTMMLPPGMMSEREPQYLNCLDVPNLMEAKQIMIEADAAFMRLPAKVRKEFDNDAMRFVEFASDPENLEQMREWGLAPPAKAPEEPMRVRVVPDPDLPPAPPAPPAAPPGAK